MSGSSKEKTTSTISKRHHVVVSTDALDRVKSYAELFSLNVGDVASEAMLYWYETSGKVQMERAAVQFSGKPRLAAIVASVLDPMPAPVVVAEPAQVAEESGMPV